MSTTVHLPEPDTSEIDYLIAREDGRVPKIDSDLLSAWAKKYGQLCHEAGVVAERERCALICNFLASLLEDGAGDVPKGARLRQAAREILSGDDSSLQAMRDLVQAAAICKG